MGCPESCALIQKIAEEGLPRVEGACSTLEQSINVSEITIKSLYELIELYEVALHRVTDYENKILKLRKEKYLLEHENQNLTNQIIESQAEKQQFIEILKKYSDEGKVFDITSFLNKTCAIIH